MFDVHIKSVDLAYRSSGHGHLRPGPVLNIGKLILFTNNAYTTCHLWLKVRSNKTLTNATIN